MDREIYIGENGLEHCSACKEPIEEFFPENVQKLFGKKHIQDFVLVEEWSTKERNVSVRKGNISRRLRRIPSFVSQNGLCGNGVLPTMMVPIRI